jgi:hypothetical protein
LPRRKENRMGPWNGKYKYHYLFIIVINRTLMY